MILDVGVVGNHKSEGKSVGEPALPLVCCMMMRMVMRRKRKEEGDGISGEIPPLPFT